VPLTLDESKRSNFSRAPHHVSEWQSTAYLLRRGMWNSLRNPAVIWLRFAMYIMLAILIGTIWLQLGDSSAVINDINGALFFTVAFMVFMSISVLPAYLEEREIFIRERANGSYGVGAYMLSHTLIEIPMLFLLSLVCSSIIYWCIGLPSNASRFFIFVANLFMSLFVAESIMVLISAVIPYFIVGIATGAFLFGAVMCVMGFFIALPQVGWWWRWMQYIALHYYSFCNAMTLVYDGTVWAPCFTGFPCSETPVLGNSILQFYLLETRYWVNFLALIAMAFVYRGFAMLYMHVFLRGRK